MSFPPSYFSISPIKHTWEKTKYFLSSHFSIFLLFHCSNQTDPKSISNRLANFFVLFGKWTVTFSFCLPTFQIHFPIDSLSHSLSHLNIISSFILYYHLFFLYLFPTIIFFNEKCYIYNILRNTFTRIITKSYMESYY